MPESKSSVWKWRGSGTLQSWGLVGSQMALETLKVIPGAPVSSAKSDLFLFPPWPLSNQLSLITMKSPPQVLVSSWKYTKSLPLDW